MNELADILGHNLLGLIVRVLGVLRGILNGEGGEFLGVEVQISGMSAKGLGVDSGNVNGTLVLFRDRLERLGEFGTLIHRLGKNVGQGDAGLES